jgi:hypothetical protein
MAEEGRRGEMRERIVCYGLLPSRSWSLIASRTRAVNAARKSFGVCTFCRIPRSKILSESTRNSIQKDTLQIPLVGHTFWAAAAEDDTCVLRLAFTNKAL